MPKGLRSALGALGEGAAQLPKVGVLVNMNKDAMFQEDEEQTESNSLAASVNNIAASLNKNMIVVEKPKVRAEYCKFCETDQDAGGRTPISVCVLANAKYDAAGNEKTTAAWACLWSLADHREKAAANVCKAGMDPCGAEAAPTAENHHGQMSVHPVVRAKYCNICSTDKDVDRAATAKPISVCVLANAKYDARGDETATASWACVWSMSDHREKATTDACTAGIVMCGDQPATSGIVGDEPETSTAVAVPPVPKVRAKYCDFCKSDKDAGARSPISVCVVANAQYDARGDETATASWACTWSMADHRERAATNACKAGIEECGSGPSDDTSAAVVPKEGAQPLAVCNKCASDKDAGGRMPFSVCVLDATATASYACLFSLADQREKAASSMCKGGIVTCLETSHAHGAQSSGFAGLAVSSNPKQMSSSTEDQMDRIMQALMFGLQCLALGCFLGVCEQLWRRFRSRQVAASTGRERKFRSVKSVVDEGEEDDETGGLIAGGSPPASRPQAPEQRR